MCNNPDVLAILRACLESRGYDGLYNEDGECACLVEDLAPCCEYFGGCKPGYKHPPPTDSCMWDYGFCIMPDKGASKEAGDV